MNGWGKAPHPPMRKVNSSVRGWSKRSLSRQDSLVSCQSFFDGEARADSSQPYSTAFTHFHESLCAWFPVLHFRSTHLTRSHRQGHMGVHLTLDEHFIGVDPGHQIAGAQSIADVLILKAVLSRALPSISSAGHVRSHRSNSF